MFVFFININCHVYIPFDGDMWRELVNVLKFVKQKYNIMVDYNQS